MERETRLELATSSLARMHSTTELLPHSVSLFYIIKIFLQVLVLFYIITARWGLDKILFLFIFTIMKKIIFIIFIFACIGAVCAQSNYNVYKPGEFSYKKTDNLDEEVLFILDFSQSMAEEIEGKRKVDLMLDTMSQILPTINPKSQVGLRVYGNRLGFTAYDACKASSLLVPIGPNSACQMKEKLAKTHPRGMTPITYSLKKAVDSDFVGFDGQKHIILLSDGGENCDESPCTWAMELIKMRKDIKIDVIAFNISDQDDLDQLQCTALVTKGKFHTAKTAADLTKSLQNSLNIHKQVDAQIIINP